MKYRTRNDREKRGLAIWALFIGGLFWVIAGLASPPEFSHWTGAVVTWPVSGLGYWIIACCLRNGSTPLFENKGRSRRR